MEGFVFNRFGQPNDDFTVLFYQLSSARENHYTLLGGGRQSAVGKPPTCASTYMAGEPEGAELLQYMVGIPVSFQVNNHSLAFIKAS